MIQHLAYIIPRNFKVGYGALFTQIFKILSVPMEGVEVIKMGNDNILGDITMSYLKLQVVDGVVVEKHRKIGEKAIESDNEKTESEEEKKKAVEKERKEKEKKQRENARKEKEKKEKEQREQLKAQREREKKEKEQQEKLKREKEKREKEQQEKEKKGKEKETTPKRKSVRQATKRVVKKQKVVGTPIKIIDRSSSDEAESGPSLPPQEQTKGKGTGSLESLEQQLRTTMLKLFDIERLCKGLETKVDTLSRKFEASTSTIASNHKEVLDKIEAITVEEVQVDEAVPDVPDVPDAPNPIP